MPYLGNDGLSRNYTEVSITYFSLNFLTHSLMLLTHHQMSRHWDPLVCSESVGPTFRYFFLCFFYNLSFKI